MNEASRYTAADIKPYKGVGAVIKGDKPEHILLQHHNKFQKWTIPVGKAELNEDPKEAIIRELKEETGIDVKELHLIHHGTDTYHVPGFTGKKGVTVPVYMYMIDKYEGKPENLEPHKHSEQDFMDPKELVLKGKPISVVLDRWLKIKRKLK